MEKAGLLESIGSRIRLVRKKRRITQKHLADMLGVTANTVGRWEDGKNGPDPVSTHRIVEMSGKSFNWFFTGQEDVATDNGIDGLPIKEDEVRLLRLYRAQTPEVQAKAAGIMIDAQLSSLT